MITGSSFFTLALGDGESGTNVYVIISTKTIVRTLPNSALTCRMNSLFRVEE